MKAGFQQQEAVYMRLEGFNALNTVPPPCENFSLQNRALTNQRLEEAAESA